MEILKSLPIEKQELALHFVEEKQKGFIPLDLCIEAIALLLPNSKDKVLSAMQVYRFLNS